MRKHVLTIIVAVLTLAGGQALAGGSIDPKAEATLRAMTAHMQALSAFSVTEASLVDRVFPNGQKVAFFHKTLVKAERPDKLRAEATGDEVSSLWLVDGPSLRVYDAKRNAYVVLDVPPRLEQALEQALAKLRLVGPMVDFLAADPYKSIMDGVLEAVYVGQSEVNGKPCHHLAFRQLTRDFELWVDAGKKPWPLRLVVTDKTLHGDPRTLIDYVDWKPVAAFGAKTFAWTPPKGAQQVMVAPQQAAPAAKP